MLNRLLMRRDRTTTGTSGYGGQNHARPSDVPGRLPSSLPSRTSSGCRLSAVGCRLAPLAYCLLPIACCLPTICLAAGDAQPATFDVAPGGILAALAAAATSALGTWAAMRNRPPRQRASTQIEGQPIKIESVPGHVTDPLCEAKHEALNGRLKDNTRDHENIFPRLAAVESRVSSLEGVVGEISKTNKSIDEKLTILLRRR